MVDFTRTNEPETCKEILEGLNSTIELMHRLTDVSYYLSYILNQCTTFDDAMAANGFTSDYFGDVAAKLEVLRSLAFGDFVEWNLIETQIKSKKED